jgi:methyl-accepting chemotaxis protein
MLQQNNANTLQATQLSEQAKDSAEKGSVEMQEMMDSMQEIKKSSDQIARIIKVIDDIAFQTNILALNAAIEAARAGEAGLGFAVVAEEVRNLAKKSSEAAKETNAIIDANISLSGKGTAVVERVRAALTEITIQTKKVNELMAEIAAASQEQAQGANEINQSMSQISTITQQNAANAEESAAAAEELNAQADSMKKIVHELSELINGKTAALKMELAYSGPENHHLSHQTTPSLEQPTDPNSKVVTPEDIIPLEKDTRQF